MAMELLALSKNFPFFQITVVVKILLDKTVIQVGINCLKCQTSVMKAVTGLTGVNKVEVNVEKHTVTVFGDVDPVAVTKNLRKKTKKTAMILSVGPEKDEPKEKFIEESIVINVHRQHRASGQAGYGPAQWGKERKGEPEARLGKGEGRWGKERGRGARGKKERRKGKGEEGEAEEVGGKKEDGERKEEDEEERRRADGRRRRTDGRTGGGGGRTGGPAEEEEPFPVKGPVRPSPAPADYMGIGDCHDDQGPEMQGGTLIRLGASIAWLLVALTKPICMDASLRRLKLKLIKADVSELSGRRRKTVAYVEINCKKCKADVLKARNSGNAAMDDEELKGELPNAGAEETVAWKGPYSRRSNRRLPTKAVIQVGIYCLKCQTSVMKAVTGLTGVNKVEVNVEKHTVTVFGDVDPVAVTKKLRKKTKKTAMILSVGPEKDEPKKTEEEGKKAAASIPSCCQN
ncbi:hypothetical protein EJ110_NYTH02352 [Nymphaea thermarum]|nr:hypothetical protein EJ110_NYTH02352 [Nymphaea thermarum]